MPVFLGHAHEKRVVTDVLEIDPPFEAHGAVGIVLRQPEHPHAAVEAPGLEHAVVVPDVVQGNIELHQRRIELQRAAVRARDPGVEPAQVSGGQGAPPERVIADPVDGLVPVEEVDRAMPLDPGAFERRRSVPDDLPETAPILRPLPDDPDAVAKIPGTVGTDGLDVIQSVEDVEALDRRRREHVDGQRDAAGRQVDDVSHRRPGRRASVRRAKIGIIVIQGSFPVERGPHVHDETPARGRVVTALAQAVEHGRARELGHEQTGQAADGAEVCGAGIACAGAALVAVGVADDADPVAHLEGVPNQPFEGAPRGVDLHRALDDAVVRELHVGVAATAMGEADDVLVRFPQGLEKVRGGVAVRVDIGLVVHQRVRRPADGAVVRHVVHVAVSAERRVPRPFVSRQGHEPSGLVELGRERVQRAPEVPGDLEVVPLMSGDVDERAVARELEIPARAVGADGLLALAVHVAPIGPQVRLLDDAKRVGAAEHGARVVQELDVDVSGRVHGKTLHVIREFARREPDSVRQAVDGPGRPQRQRPAGLVGGIAPLVFRLDREAERLAGLSRRRAYGDPAVHRSRNQPDRRLDRQLLVVVGGDGVDEDAELERILAERLETHTGGALAGIAEGDGDRVALPHEPADDLDVEGAVPGPDVSLGVVTVFQNRVVAGDDRGVIGSLRIVELRAGLIGREPEDDTQASRVVDAEISAGVRQGKGLVGTRLELPAGNELGVTELVGFDRVFENSGGRRHRPSWSRLSGRRAGDGYTPAIPAGSPTRISPPDTTRQVRPPRQSGVNARLRPSRCSSMRSHGPVSPVISSRH